MPQEGAGEALPGAAGPAEDAGLVEGTADGLPDGAADGDAAGAELTGSDGIGVSVATGVRMPPRPAKIPFKRISANTIATASTKTLEMTSRSIGFSAGTADLAARRRSKRPDPRDARAQRQDAIQRNAKSA